MKVIGNLPIPKKTDSNLPFGATVQNQTETQQGTPIVDDVWQDIFSNMYQLMKLAGITPTDAFDSDLTQYQIVDALKKFSNGMNDIEQVLSLDGSVWGVNLSFGILPNKYWFFARASDNYDSGADYSIVGNDDTGYTFVSTGFKAGDELLIVLDNTGARAYSINSINETAKNVFTVFGMPLAFNDTNKMWYQEDGKILSDVPTTDNLEAVIQTDLGDSTVILQDIFVMQGKVLCFCLIPSTNNYFFRQFDLTDFSSSVEVTISGGTFGSSDDFSPYVYCESGFVWVTNALNNHIEDYSIFKFAYDSASSTLTIISTNNLEASFTKTTNAVIKNGSVITMVNGQLKNYNLTSGTVIDLGYFDGSAGQLFGFNGEVYFTSGEVATKWF